MGRSVQRHHTRIPTGAAIQLRSPPSFSLCKIPLEVASISSPCKHFTAAFLWDNNANEKCMRMISSSKNKFPSQKSFELIPRSEPHVSPSPSTDHAAAPHPGCASPSSARPALLHKDTAGPEGTRVLFAKRGESPLYLAFLAQPNFLEEAIV